MRWFRTIGALLCSAGILLSAACSGGAQEPKAPLEVDLTPAAGEGTVTPPFWVVEDPQTGAQVFLLGSMHAGTEDTVYPEYVMEAYRNSTYIAPELDTIAFSGNSRLVSECAGYLRLQSGTAADYIPDHDRVVEYFSSLGLYSEALEYMTPFYWTSVFSSAVLDGSGLQTDFGTETTFLTMAHRERKEIREVEGAAAQYRMMGGVPMSVQTELLSECAGDEQLREQEESTLELYDAWSRFDDEYFSGLEVYDPGKVGKAGNAEDWQTYYDMMYSDRQRGMAQFVLDALHNGDQAFVFVGTMHFYAEPSIISLLGAEGYTVNAIRPEGQAQTAASDENAA